MASTVLILLDAFRSDYLSDDATPFLASCARKGSLFRTVTPSIGFCERSEILTGQPPAITGNLTAIGYSPTQSAYGRLATWLERAERLHSIGFLGLESVVRHGLVQYARLSAPIMRPYRIPLSFLPFFALTEDYFDHTTPEAFPVPSIFSQLRERGRSYYVKSFTSLRERGRITDETRLRLALSAARHHHDLYLIYLGWPDALGHRHGPEALKASRGLRRMDAILSDFVQAFQSVIPSAAFVFLGDHGMTPVHTRVDIGSIIVRTGLRMNLIAPRDYLYFLDSTLCRLWFRSQRAQTAFSAALSSDAEMEENGVFVGTSEAERWSIPSDRRYGDLIWWANPGVLIAPDFFHGPGDRVKGMHGYDPMHPDSQGLCIVYGPPDAHGEVDNIGLADVHDILLSCILS